MMLTVIVQKPWSSKVVKKAAMLEDNSIKYVEFLLISNDNVTNR